MIGLVNSTGLTAIDLGLRVTGGAIHEVALHYPVSTFTSSAASVIRCSRI